MATTYKKLVLPPALGNYAFLWKAREPMEGSAPGAKPKFSVALVWSKKDVTKLKPLIDGILETAKTKFGPSINSAIDRLTKKNEKITLDSIFEAAKLRNPLRDGDTDRPDDKNFANSYFITASSEKQPGIVDANSQEVFEQAEAYSGCTFRAAVALYPYDKAGNKGVGVGLNNVQVTVKGPRLDGRKSASEEFADYAGQTE